MRSAGPFGDLAFVLTGRVGEATLRRATAAALRPPPPEEVAGAIRRLQDAGIDPRPFAAAAGGMDAAALSARRAGPALLDAADWAALRAVCD